MAAAARDTCCYICGEKGAEGVLPLVLIDATPLRARSGVRGIGRYVRDLLLGLSATRDGWGGSVRIAAIEDLGLDGRCVVNEDLTAAAEVAFAARDTRGAGLVHARRLVLGRGAAKAGASLLHITEALGTPIRCRVPRLVTCHDLIRLRYPAHYVRDPLSKFVRQRREGLRYGSAEHLVAISRHTADDLVAVVGGDGREIHVIPHGVDLEKFHAQASPGDDDAALQTLGLGGRRFVIYAGGADWRKNVEGMLGSLAVARRSVDVDLVWAGSLGKKDVRRVRSEARSAGVERNVRLLGFVADAQLAALYRRAVAHLFLSRLEGFGLSVVEAMATGCPVVVARGSGSDEIAGEAGEVVDADDRESAGRAISSLSGDPQERARRVALGLVRARYFDRNRMARDYAALYSATCRPGPARAR